MKKFLVAAAVLLAAGAAVAGAMHVKSSLDRGVCPLTGKPIACRSHSSTPPAAASRVAETSAPVGYAAMSGEAAPAASQTLAADGDESVCPKTRRHCCCPSKQREQCAPKQVEQPAAPQTQNP